MQNDIKNEERLPKETVLGYVRQMMDSDEYVHTVKTYVREVGEKNNTRYKYDEVYDYLATNYTELNDRYPGIVKMFANDCFEGVDFDINRLEKMLSMLDMMNVSERKPEVVTDTNVSVMKELRNEYVLPKLGMQEEDVDEIDPEKYKDVDWDKTNIKFNTSGTN